MAKFYCKYCGNSYSTLTALTACSCPRHPDGPGRGKHALYEGDEKDRYVCKYCGNSYSTLTALTACSCPRHPDGPGKGKHSPAL